ncbi:MAG: HEAT repeat domain-containing protein, partial [Candidatus Eisenbacteria bacterium]
MRTTLVLLALCTLPAPTGAGTLWNPPGIAAPERPPEHAPWPPRDPASREAWAEIAMLEDTRTTDLARLVGHLQSSPDPLVRWRVCRAFARLQDSTSVAPLLDALAGDADVAVRREAAFALGQVASRQATLALAAAAREQPDLAVRARALEALGKIGDKRGTGAVAAHLTHPEADLSREAAIACWRLADSAAVMPLTEALKQKDGWTRAFAAYALEKTPMPGVVLKPLTRLVGDREVVVRANVARALGRQRVKDALGPLVRLAGDRDPRVRISAVRALGALADSAALPQALAALGDDDPHVRETAAAALQALGSRDAAPRLRTALKDTDGGVRLAAARALAALSPETAYQDLLELQADPERWVRAGIFDTFGRLPGEEPLLTVKKVAAGIRPIGGAASAEERAGAFSGLAAVPARAAGRDEVIAGLRDGHWLVAASAAEAAGASADSTLVPELTWLLHHNPDPREVDVPLSALAAVTALGRGAARGPGAVELRATLDSVLADPDLRLRAAAGAAYAAAFGDSALATARAAHPAPAWQAGALAPWRAALAEQDSSGAIGRVRGARLETARGTIEIALFPREAPLTVKNFVTLARRGYFNGLHLHRVVPWFVIQDGDPSGTGSGGPGYAFRCEYGGMRYDTGALGMALSGKDTGGSQWFVTNGPQPHLDGRYTIFGHVVRGQDVVDRMRRGDLITRVTIL